MRRLFTILLTTTLFATLSFGQMVVKGNVVNVGDMRSDGTVYLKAESSTALGKIDNKGKLQLQKGITFYSDVEPGGIKAGGDGMLKDASSTSSVVLTSTTKGDYSVVKHLNTGGWYFITFPFDVNIKDITNDAGREFAGTSSVPYNAFWIRRFDASNRANAGVDNASWQLVTTKDTLLSAGEMFEIGITAGGVGNYTFPSNGTIQGQSLKDNLYTKDNIRTGLHHVHSNVHGTHSGWNVVGTLQTTTFHLTDANGVSNIEYVGGSPSLDAFVFQNNKWGALTVSAPAGNDKDVSVAPFHGFFIQTKETGTPTGLKFKSAGRSLYDGHLRSSVSSDYTMFELVIYGQNRDDSDYLRVWTGEEFSNVYVAGEDAVKFLASSTEVDPQFYTLLENEAMQINRYHALSSSDEIPVGLVLAGNGEYTIELNNMVGYESTGLNVYLIDRYNNNEWHNLSEKNYTFNASGKIEDRFVLRVSNAPTAISSPVSNIIVYTEGNAAYVKNVKVGDEVSIYNITGQLITRGTATASEQSYRLQGTGVYVVKVTGSQTFVSKVINK